MSAEEQNNNQANNQAQQETKIEQDNNVEGQKLSEADKKVYNQIFQSLKKIDKKVQTAKNKLQNSEGNKQGNNLKYEQMAQKLIESKQNSQIANKQDILTDINQSYERAVIDIYTDNQKMKKKMQQMQKIIKDQNYKIFEQQKKQELLNQEIDSLRLQLARLKDDHLINNRGVKLGQQQQSRIKQGINKKNTQGKFIQNQNEDYDFWNMPQNDNNYNNKKKEFIENSGLWVNHKNNNDSAFITEGRH